MSNLTSIITTGLNNPDCAFYTGAFIGQAMTFRIIFVLAFVYLAVKLLDELVINPSIDAIKKKARKLWRKK